MPKDKFQNREVIQFRKNEMVRVKEKPYHNFRAGVDYKLVDWSVLGPVYLEDEEGDWQAVNPEDVMKKEEDENA